MVPVVMSGTVTDNESGGTGINPSSVNYAVMDEYGRVQPSGPLTLDANGNYSLTISLEAARNGDDKDGRQCKIFVNARDNAGNLGSAFAVVTVPHDQRH